jgi:hypothetical protein
MTLIEEKRNLRYHKNYNLPIYSIVGLIGAIALTGFITSGGMLPNTGIESGTSSKSPASSSSLPSTDFGKVEGYVDGPTGLPAIGASVVAYKENGVIDSVQKERGFTANSFVSIDGKYSFNLPSGLYRLTVAYPDGTYQVITDYAVWPGSSSSFHFGYRVNDDEGWVN